MPKAAKGTKPSVFLARRMIELRARRGWSQADLADELNARGVDVDRTAVARIEANAKPKPTPGQTRNVSVDEVYGIAATFGISPRSLLLFDDPVQIGSMTVPARRMRTWVNGDGPLRPEDADSYWSERSADELVASSAAVLGIAQHGVQKAAADLAKLSVDLEKQRSALAREEGGKR